LHFTESETEGKKTCRYCNSSVSRSTTVLKRHLRTTHSEKYLNFEKDQERLNKSKKNATVLSRTQALQNVKSSRPFSHNSGRKKQIDDALGLVAALPTCSMNFLLHPRVKHLQFLMESQYLWPNSSTKLLSLIENPYGKMMRNLQEIVSSAKKIALSADVWSQQGMSRSYIAITAHFYSEKSEKLQGVSKEC
jgi:hypothetical protein